jgi:hypothetical protein
VDFYRSVKEKCDDFKKKKNFLKKEKNLHVGASVDAWRVTC